MVETAFPLVQQLLKDPQHQVVESALETVRRIAEFHP